MSKNTKTTPKKAPTTPKVEATAQPITTDRVDFKNVIEEMSSESKNGLDPNHQVDLLKLAHDIYGKDSKAAERYGMKQETVDNINKVTAIGVAVAMSREVVFAKNEFAMLMNKAELNTILEICDDIGVTINQRLLPAPNEDGKIEIPSAAVVVSEETEKKIREEESVRAKEAKTDPTKIETEEQLIETLKNIMIVRNNVFQKLNDSINFYQAYLKVKANKAENKDEELKKVNEKSRIELLKEMAKLIGACPLVLNGVGRYMHGVTSTSKNPITAFCMLRNSTKNRKTGVYAITDAEVADYVRTLIEWTNDTKIADEKRRIEDLKNSLEVLKQDEKNNSAGIADVKSKIEIAEKNLKHFDEVLSYVLAPDANIPSSLIESFVAKDAGAIRIVKAITDSYYDDIKIKEMKQDGIRHNVEQYAGIIINLFRDPAARLDQYSESNLIQLEPINSNEEKPAEEPKKELA